MASVLLMALQFNGPHAGKNRVELIKLMIHKCWLIVYFKFFTSSTIGTSQIGGSSSAVDHQIGILPPDASWIHDFETPVRENSRLQAMYSTGIKLLEPDLKLWINFKKYFFIDGLGLLRTERSCGRPRTRTQNLDGNENVRRRQIFDFHGTPKDEDVHDGHQDWYEEVRGRPLSRVFGLGLGRRRLRMSLFGNFWDVRLGGLRRIVNRKDVFVRRDLTQYL